MTSAWTRCFLFLARRPNLASRARPTITQHTYLPSVHRAAKPFLVAARTDGAPRVCCRSLNKKRERSPFVCYVGDIWQDNPPARKNSTRSTSSVFPLRNLMRCNVHKHRSIIVQYTCVWVFYFYCLVLGKECKESALLVTRQTRRGCSASNESISGPEISCVQPAVLRPYFCARVAPPTYRGGKVRGWRLSYMTTTPGLSINNAAQNTDEFGEESRGRILKTGATDHTRSPEKNDLRRRRH